MIDVLANDRNPGGRLDPTTLRLASAPTKGRALVARGRMRYEAPDGGVGQDRFSYAVEDRTGSCTSAEVVVTLG